MRIGYVGVRVREYADGVPQVSYEMASSIAMVRRSYHRRQSVRAAREFFNIGPRCCTENVVAFCRQSSKKFQNR